MKRRAAAALPCGDEVHGGGHGRKAERTRKETSCTDAGEIAFVGEQQITRGNSGGRSAAERDACDVCAVLDQIERRRFVVRGVILPEHIAPVQVHVRSIHAGVEHADGDVGVAIKSRHVSRKARSPDGAHTSGARGLIQMQHRRAIFLNLHERIAHGRRQRVDFPKRQATVPTVGHGLIEVGDLTVGGKEVVEMPLRNLSRENQFHFGVFIELTAGINAISRSRGIVCHGF